MADIENAVTPTPENPIPDVDDIKPGIPSPAWADEGGGTVGGILVINPSENNFVTIGGVTYNLITFIPNEIENMPFILVDPSVLTSPQAIYFYDSENQGYELVTQCGFMQTGTISPDNVDQDNIYPTSPITVWRYVSVSREEPYILIPNNAPYAVGTHDR